MEWKKAKLARFEKPLKLFGHGSVHAVTLDGSVGAQVDEISFDGSWIAVRRGAEVLVKPHVDVDHLEPSDGADFEAFKKKAPAKKSAFSKK